MEKNSHFDVDSDFIYELITKSPGKVLVCGGYLVINPKYRGVVLCTKTYFECKGKIKIKFLEKKKENFLCSIIIRVNSIIFKKSFFYKVQIKEKESFLTEDLNLSFIFKKTNFCNIEEFLKQEKYIEFENEDKELKNEFIDNSLKCAIYYFFLNFLSNKNDNQNFINEIKNKIFFMNIDLNADYRFYGCNKNFVENNINKNIKTGLGSSSALITSLTSNIILNLCQIKDKEKFIKKTNFNDYEHSLKTLILLAALNSNNLAQNKVNEYNYLSFLKIFDLKIGSGFDIISCLLGSQIFQRKIISQQMIECFNNNSDYISINKDILNKYIKLRSDLLEEDYINNIQRVSKSFFNLNFSYSIISIEKGTNTRNFVKKILDFANEIKKKEIFDDVDFQNLNIQNEKLINLFEQERSNK